MTTFAKASFDAASYAAFRPSYPASLYNTVLRYHLGPRGRVIDLGCGHGVVPRYLSKEFKHVLGVDPSEGMIGKAQDLTPKAQYPNVEYQVGSAESLPFLEDESVDMVVAAQAAHWFDYPKLFPELKRVLRKQGTVAFWGYKDHVYCGHPKASQMSVAFCYGTDPTQPSLLKYWEPGRFITVDKLRPIKPPETIFEDVERIEYEPNAEGKGLGEGTLYVEKQMSVGQSIQYYRTFSAWHEWEKEHPHERSRDKGGAGDQIDIFHDRMKEIEGWTDDSMVDLEWGSGLLMCRRR